MAKKANPRKELEQQGENRWLDPVRVAFGLGALATDGATDLLERARARGRQVEPGLRAKVVGSGRDLVSAVRALPGTVVRALQGLRLPARQDLERLESKLDALARKVAA